jgi:hypothetical protein
MTSRLLTVCALASSIAFGVVALGSDPAGAASGSSRSLVGTFKLQAGSCVGTSVTGTYFQMISPGGTVATGPFFNNPGSTCANKAYTLLAPGTKGGLVTGKYQPNPTPAFDAQGGALANSIVQPTPFTSIAFSVATNSTDPQTSLSVPPPAIKVNKNKLSGQVQGWSASWNKLYFNQGSPKPGGSKPGLTAALTGTYNAKSRAFVITWTSQIVGGPFNGFTGSWHLAGKFAPAR